MKAFETLLNYYKYIYIYIIFIYIYNIYIYIFNIYIYIYIYAHHVLNLFFAFAIWFCCVRQIAGSNPRNRICPGKSPGLKSVLGGFRLEDFKLARAMASRGPGNRSASRWLESPTSSPDSDSDDSGKRSWSGSEKSSISRWVLNHGDRDLFFFGPWKTQVLLGIFGLEPKDLNVELFFLFDRHFFCKKQKCGFQWGVGKTYWFFQGNREHWLMVW